MQSDAGYCVFCGSDRVAEVDDLGRRICSRCRNAKTDLVLTLLQSESYDAERHLITTIKAGN